MDIQTLNAAVTPDRALACLREYKEHRNAYDKRDWEIERIYRAISRGKTIINALSAVRRAGIDARGRPRLAIMRADQPVCICEHWRSASIIFRARDSSRASDRYIEIPWPQRPPESRTL